MGILRKYCCSKISLIAILGATLVIVGGILVVAVDILISNRVKKETVLVETSMAFDSWVETPTPLYMQYYVWNLTNSKAFLEGAIPEFQELGPYTYREIRRKTNISFDDEDDTVTFYNYKAYIFEPDLSVGWDNDTFFTVDLLTVTFGSLAKYSEILRFLHKIIHRGSKSNFIIEVSVRGFLYGFEQPYFTFVKRLQDIFKITDLPVSIPTEFGIFSDANDTTGNEWVVYAGEKDLSLVNQIKTWDNKTSLHFWSNDFANMLNGTDGQAFHPLINEGEDLHIYVPDICRSGVIEYMGPNELHGVPTAKYTAPAYQYASAEEYPDNIGFCTPDENGCAPTGLLNATNCKLAPIFYSSPHFLYGSQKLRESVIGFNPVREQHMVDFDIHLLTGVTLQVSNRVQVNIKVEPLRQISPHLTAWVFPNILPRAFRPTSKTVSSSSSSSRGKASSSLDEAMAEVIKTDVQRVLLIADCVLAAVFSLGTGLLVGAILIVLVKLFRAKKRKKTVDRQVMRETERPTEAENSFVNTQYDHVIEENRANKPTGPEPQERSSKLCEGDPTSEEDDG